jgi:leucyl aminopeptidase
MNEYTPDISRRIGAEVTKYANKIKATTVAGVVRPTPISRYPAVQRVEAFVEGIVLGSYKFERYKDKKDVEANTLKEIIFVMNGNGAKIEDAAQRSRIIAENVNFARDLGNIPSNDLTPSDLAAIAKDIASKNKMRCVVLGPKEIKEERMNLLLAVNHASENEPRFVHASYRPAKKTKTKVAIIGKGITFDSGGYNLKPGSYMYDMKNDMAGAAACIALMNIIGSLKPNVAIDFYMPMTDNMIDAKGEVPGNIIKSRNGKTVEIISADAEGRLILADAISYALDNKPDYIVDIATLTGGVLYALGEIYTAVLGNNQKLVDKYLKAAMEANEPAWQLPLVKEYKKSLAEGPADLKNQGKSRASAIEGALFLAEFVGETKWVHLDIAESAWCDEEKDYIQKGSTGATIRTLARLLGSI